MDARRAALLTLIKMAQHDGRVVDAEARFIVDTANKMGFADIKILAREAAATDLDQLLRRIFGYEDRFFIALYAYLLAQADGVVDARENYAHLGLIAKLAIRPEDRRLIEDIQTHSSLRDFIAQHPRLRDYVRNSSFTF